MNVHFPRYCALFLMITLFCCIQAYGGSGHGIERHGFAVKSAVSTGHDPSENHIGGNPMPGPGEKAKAAGSEGRAGMTRGQHVEVSFDMMILGGLLALCIFYLASFFFYRKEILYASFGTLCLAAGTAILASSRTNLLGMDEAASARTVLVSYALCIPLYITYMRSLTARRFNKAAVQVMWTAGVIACILVSVTPYVLYSRVMILYDVLSLAVCVYAAAAVFKMRTEIRKTFYLVLTSSGLVCLSVVCGILSKSGVLNNGNIPLYGFSAFVLLQIYPLSSRFIDSFNKEISLDLDLRNKSVELEKSKNLLKYIFDSQSSLLFTIDGNLIITGINEFAFKYLLDPDTDVVGRKLFEVIPVKEDYENLINEVIKTGKTINLKNEHVMDGNDRLFNVSISPLVHNESSGVVIFADDVTEMNRKEEQIKHAQQMETIGLLAGGLAHDFNNALGGILTTSTLMKYCIDEGIEAGRIQERASMIERAATNAAGFVNSFLHLTRRHDVVIAPVNLNDSVQHIVKICRDTFDKSIEITAEYILEDAYIMADELQIEHVLLNLCINASQAMTTMRMRNEVPGGLLNIAIGDLGEDSDILKRHTYAERCGYWTVSVSDTGVGMDADTIPMIFETFFSKKESGTGLGLAMADRIVRQHGGFIEVKSEKGKGSIFMLCFKKYTGSVDKPASKKSVKVHDQKEPGGMILLAEDDNVIRDMTKELLEENGYGVIEASNGEEALNLYKERHYELIGVFMDIEMPVMSGMDAFLAMKEIDPDVKVLLTSGFAHDPAVKDAIAKGIKAFMRKPYSVHELMSKIKEFFY